ncbi:MAG: biopolymer transporter ExbD [Desulfobacula sp.]|jgi:biopolymer transport protein ExbD|nr:biopolymer transporter ExbD [Desulfobacula sp.]
MRRNFFTYESFNEINVTPLLDLAWTLLVVFIIAVTASVQGIKIDLPKASAAPSLTKPKTKAVTIDDKGQIYLDAYPVTMAELEQNLRVHKAADPNFPVVVKGDAKIYYQSVMDILDLMQRLEITQLGLVTQRLVK